MGRNFIHSNPRANEFLGNNQASKYSNNPEMKRIREQRLMAAQKSAKLFEEDLLNKFRSKNSKPSLLHQSEKGCSDKFKQDLLQKSERGAIQDSHRMSDRTANGAATDDFLELENSEDNNDVDMFHHEEKLLFKD